LVLAVAVFVAVGWCLSRVLLRRPGYLLLLVISFSALWVGGLLVPTLLHGYVLTAVPTFLARTASVLCLGSGVAILLLIFRMVEQADREHVEQQPGDSNQVAGEIPA
jgi:hypothetical protein